MVLTRTAQVFERIYRSNAWKGTTTRAGPGSTAKATARLAAELPKLMTEHNMTSILDAGCNEASWVPELPGYIGVDVSPGAIEKATALHPERDFRLADITTDKLPRCDVVLSRDAMQHLSLKDGVRALANFRRSGASWLIASSHRDEKNVNIATGRWYPINLQAAPFNLPEPEWYIPDGVWDSGERYPRKVIGLWKL